MGLARRGEWWGGERRVGREVGCSSEPSQEGGHWKEETLQATSWEEASFSTLFSKQNQACSGPSTSPEGQSPFLSFPPHTEFDQLSKGAAASDTDRWCLNCHSKGRPNFLCQVTEVQIKVHMSFNQRALHPISKWLVIWPFKILGQEGGKCVAHAYVCLSHGLGGGSNLKAEHGVPKVRVEGGARPPKRKAVVKAKLPDP